MMTGVTLYDLNMNEINLRGVTWLEFTPDGGDAEFFTESSYNGEEVLGKASKSRLINARFMFESADRLDYKLLMKELRKVFSPLKTMWAVDNEMPGIKWLVDVSPGSFSPDRINGRVAEVSMSFYSRKPHSRSIGTSLDEFTFDSGLWSYGMGLQADANVQNYIHTATEFIIYNPSDTVIDPREHELEITILNSGNSVNGIEISNENTGDLWKYNGIVLNGETITLSGVKAFKNGANIVGDTNFGIITLAEGWNEIHIKRMTSGNFTTQFKFPFLYV